MAILNFKSDASTFPVAPAAYSTNPDIKNTYFPDQWVFENDSGAEVYFSFDGIHDAGTISTTSPILPQTVNQKAFNVWFRIVEGGTPPVAGNYVRATAKSFT